MPDSIRYVDPPNRQELAAIEQTLAQLEAAAAVRRDTEAREAERLHHDDASYWSRRFNTSLAIGNGAGFALVTGALLQSQHIDQALVFAWQPMCCFGPGLLCAGALPWLLWAQRRSQKFRRAAQIASALLTTLAAGFFVLAIGTAVYTVTAAQKSAATVARAQRAVEGAELAKRWKAAGLGAAAAPTSHPK